MRASPSNGQEEDPGKNLGSPAQEPAAKRSKTSGASRAGNARWPEHGVSSAFHRAVRLRVQEGREVQGSRLHKGGKRPVRPQRAGDGQLAGRRSARSSKRARSSAWRDIGTATLKTSRTAEQLAKLAMSLWCCRSEIRLFSIEGRGSRLWWLWYTWCNSFERLT